ncbi:hypothetical protein [Apilactobacillus timberlakei]|uniref:hypothetical protein n=1 Tax=Apilactobacillus timberlakei TaxID=2008380 RepID=UPI0015E85DD5|nr:hypothetical protein [Apilactobacillus timberlakei]
MLFSTIKATIRTNPVYFGKFPGKNDEVDILNVYIGNMKLVSSINESVSFDIKVDK